MFYNFLCVGEFPQTSGQNQEIWRSPEMSRFRTLRHKNKVCLNCPLVKTCLGGCRVRAYGVLGNPELPDPACDKIYQYPEAPGEIIASWEISSYKVKI